MADVTRKDATRFTEVYGVVKLSGGHLAGFWGRKFESAEIIKFTGNDQCFLVWSLL